LGQVRQDDERTREIRARSSDTTLWITTSVALGLWIRDLRPWEGASLETSVWRSPMTPLLAVVALAWFGSRFYFAWRLGGGDILGEQPWAVLAVTIIYLAVLLTGPLIAAVYVLVGALVTLAIFWLMGRQ
ncbi:MAG: hypothetical protein ACYC53_08635, partial [Bacillota bacterium]